MTNATIIGLVGLVIAAVFAAVYFLPTMLTKGKASALGLNLRFDQARTIANGYCNQTEFLMDVKDIWFWADIPIDKLISHFHAKGSLRNLREGIIEMKQKNINVDFSILAAFDLAGRDLKEEIKKAEKKNWAFDLTTE